MHAFLFSLYLGVKLLGYRTDVFQHGRISLNNCLKWLHQLKPMCKNSFWFGLSFFKDKLRLLPTSPSSLPSLYHGSFVACFCNFFSTYTIFQNSLTLSHLKNMLKLKFSGDHPGKAPGEASGFSSAPVDSDHQGSRGTAHIIEFKRNR